MGHELARRGMSANHFRGVGHSLPDVQTVDAYIGWHGVVQTCTFFQAGEAEADIIHC